MVGFLEGDLWVFVADLIAGDFEDLKLGLVRLGLEFSEILEISGVFDRLVCGFFVGVDDTVFLTLESIGEPTREAERCHLEVKTVNR